MKVAVLGMGDMGRALAERLQHLGYVVTVWNRTPGKSGPLPEARSASEAVESADAVLVVVRDGAAVVEVCTDQLLTALAPRSHLLVVTTVAPEIVRGIAAKLPGRVLDTPVLGSPEMIGAGAGQFLVGGDDIAAQAISGLLDDLGASHAHCGPVGSGTVMKTVSNLQLVLGVAALAEAVATARGHGIRDDVLTAVFSNSVMVSEGAKFGLSAMLDPEHGGVLGPVADAVKDVRLALDLAGDLNLVLAPAALDLLGRVAGKDWPDFSAVIEGIGPSTAA